MGIKHLFEGAMLSFHMPTRIRQAPQDLGELCTISLSPAVYSTVYMNLRCSCLRPLSSDDHSLFVCDGIPECAML